MFYFFPSLVCQPKNPFPYAFLRLLPIYVRKVLPLFWYLNYFLLGRVVFPDLCSMLRLTLFMCLVAKRNGCDGFWREQASSFKASVSGPFVTSFSSRGKLVSSGTRRQTLGAQNDLKAQDDQCYLVVSIHLGCLHLKVKNPILERLGGSVC